MSIQSRISYTVYPESPASSTEAAISFDKYPVDQAQIAYSRIKGVPRLPNLEQTIIQHNGVNGHLVATKSTASASLRALLPNDEVTRMRKLKRRLFLEAVAKSAEWVALKQLTRLLPPPTTVYSSMLGKATFVQKWLISLGHDTAQSLQQFISVSSCTDICMSRHTELHSLLWTGQVSEWLP